MKLKNKRTGEIRDFKIHCYKELSEDGNPIYAVFDGSIEDWEDYQEPKEHWCITMYGGITRIKDDEEPIDDLIEIGNYFNSKEDAYDAWDNLKAWKRLKDKGFEITGFEHIGANGWVEGKINFLIPKDNLDEADLDLLFGGEK